MAIDIKAKIEELINKIKGDKEIGTKFQKEPTKTVEELIGVDLPEDQIKTIVEGVKAKINLDKLGSVGEKLGGLFGGK